MTLEAFILLYVGTGMDFDGRFGYQCVDLYRYYLHDVLQIPQSPPVVGAADIWMSPPPECVKIPNTPTNIPLPGDMVVWSRNYGPFGHVGIFYLGDVMKFVSFDQNLPTGTLAHLQHHTYANVLGWLRVQPFEDV